MANRAACGQIALPTLPQRNVAYHIEVGLHWQALLFVKNGFCRQPGKPKAPRVRMAANDTEVGLE